MIKIAPSILASDFSKLGEEIIRIDKAGADIVHIDVMDGHFVPNITIGPPVVRQIRKVTDLDFDVHLMIENPEKYIDQFADAGADIISVHPEACIHLDKAVGRICEMGVRPAVALNPSTPLNVLDWVLDKIDMVLIMTVNPGFGGQEFITGMIKKVSALKEIILKRNLDVDIEVDGGIGLDNIYEITRAGANVIVAGSSIYRVKDVKEIIENMKNRAWDEK